MTIHCNPAKAIKIFGIGLSKTGTTSLANALQILGYKVKDNPGIGQYVRGDLSSMEGGVLDEYDALTDTPIPSFYRELDARYRDAKFILTVRDMEGWLKSCKKQFTKRLADKQNEAHDALFMDLYGCTVFDERRFENGYIKFVSGVLTHFKNRPEDLLILNIAAGDGWEKLCSFLGKPTLDVPFPKSNVTQIRWMNMQEVAHIARQAGEELLAAYRLMHGKSIWTAPAREGLSTSLGCVGRRARYAMCRDLPKTAARRAYKLIDDKLKRLNPEIPVISPHGPDIAYTERREWNHFWLVDPLENVEGFLERDASFTINIALIEDRKPVIGVVYAPLVDTIYYAASDKGAFRGESGAEAGQLVPSRARAREPSESEGQKARGDQKGPISKALSMCLVADKRTEIALSIRESMEWQTAAADAVLRAVGVRVTNCDSRKDLTYNKETLANGCIAIG